MAKVNFDVNTGLPALSLFVSWLNKNKKNWKHATTEEQHDGIDIVTTNQKAEVKTTKKHSQLAIEDIGDVGKPGWIYTTKSSVIVFVNVTEKFAWVIPTKELRMYYYKTKDHHGLFDSPVTYGERGDVYTSKHRWYSIDELKENMEVKRIDL